MLKGEGCTVHVGGQLTILRLHGSWDNSVSNYDFCFSSLVLKSQIKQGSGKIKAKEDAYSGSGRIFVLAL